MDKICDRKSFENVKKTKKLIIIMIELTFRHI